MTAALSALLKFLSHPLTIILGVILGFASGFYLEEFSRSLKPLANIYITLLSMCLLPILVSALVWGIGQMLRNPLTRPLFGRMGAIYAVSLFIPCIVGIAIALAFDPGGSLSQSAADALGGEAVGVKPPGQTTGFLGFFTALIPSNVFEALSEGQFLSIVFFCALVGLALGMVDSPGADEALRVLNALYKTFSTVFHWILVPLPIGLFCIVAYHMAEANNELLAALVVFIGFYWLAGIIVLIIHSLTLSAVTRTPPWRPLIAFKTPLILAFATDNPFIALYSAIESLQREYKVDREVADTIVPFGVLANQHGQILLFAFTSVFLAQVYQVDLGVTQYLILVVGATIAGAAAVGGGAVLAPILAPVLLGIGIPDTLAVVLLATTQPAVANISSMLTVQATCNLAVLTAHGRERPQVAPAVADGEPAVEPES